MKAVVHVGPIKHRDIVREFYQNCSLDSNESGQWTTGDIVDFDTFEQLVEQIDARGEWLHIVVCHGNPKDGLLCRFVRGATHTATGGLIAELASAADQSGLSASSSNVRDMASRMGTHAADVLRLVEKLAKVRRRNPTIDIRGCNVGKNREMLQGYAQAFGAASVCAPDVRMFYLRTIPGKLGSKRTFATLDHGNSTTKVRHRLFEKNEDPVLAAAGPLFVKVEDIDGHENVKPSSVLTKPADAPAWARALNGEWRRPPGGALSTRFVFQVMWGESTNEFWTALEPGYRSHFVRV